MGSSASGGPPTPSSAGRRSPSCSPPTPRWSPRRKASSTSTSRPGPPARPSATCSHTPRACHSRGRRRSPVPASAVSTRTRASTCWRTARRTCGDALRGVPAASVLDPLGLVGTELQGRPSEGLHGTLADLAAFGRELLAPPWSPRRPWARRRRSSSRPRRRPPGPGRQEPNDWGLGFELKDAKRPHWTGSANSPRTFGHFGGAGTFLWVDPDARVACACLTDLEFGEWARRRGRALADAILTSPSALR